MKPFVERYERVNLLCCRFFEELMFVCKTGFSTDDI
jgi:hypothetical protein